LIFELKTHRLFLVRNEETFYDSFFQRSWGEYPSMNSSSTKIDALAAVRALRSVQCRF